MDTSTPGELQRLLAQWPAPVIIGGTGGSGTRLIAQILRSVQVSLGGNINHAEDALDFVSIYDKYIDAYLENGSVDVSRFELDIGAAILRHRKSATGTPWGWKNPRSIYLLPLLDRVIPGMLFVHVVRHGIDMALSRNQNQLERHGRAALGPACDSLTAPMRSALLWQRVNEAAADYGREMPGRYFLVRYEDACANPREHLAPIACVLGLDPAAENWPPPIDAVAPRWPSLEAERLSEFRAAIGPALERFGYRC